MEHDECGDDQRAEEAVHAIEHVKGINNAKYGDYRERVGQYGVNFDQLRTKDIA